MVMMPLSRPRGGLIRRSPRRLPSLFAALISAGLPFWGLPAAALERVVLKIPLLDATLTIPLAELRHPSALLHGNSELAELDRASGGAVGRQLIALLQTPVPISLSQFADGSAESPLLEQALLVLSSFGQLDGRQPDLTGHTLQEALRRSSLNGKPTLLGLMEAIPGRSVTVDLGRALFVAQRMASQHQRAQALMASVVPVAPPADAALAVSALPVVRSEVLLPVAHRPRPLAVVILRPGHGANGRLVLISHGLWDGPASFEGWAQALVHQGYTVALPRHPGSDASQQRAMLQGQLPPPGPEELALRPLDVSAVIDAAAVGRLPGAAGTRTDRVVVIGHSWGATTALQLAGLRPQDTRLRSRCADLKDPERNLSWTLQCSWLKGTAQAARPDPRVLAVVAVSPPLTLLLDQGAAQQLTGRALVVSGSLDWVVPPDPEAITPMAASPPMGHRLVLAEGGDHFNLRPGGLASGGVLGPLIVAWTDGAFTAGAAARPAAGASRFLAPQGWGDAAIPLRDVSDQLRRP